MAVASLTWSPFSPVLAAADPEDPIAAADVFWPNGPVVAGPAPPSRACVGSGRPGGRPAGHLARRFRRRPRRDHRAVLEDVALRRCARSAPSSPIPSCCRRPGKIQSRSGGALCCEFKYGINAYLAYIAEFGFAGVLPAHPGRADRLQQAERGPGAVALRPGGLRAGRGDQRQPGRPRVPVARREATRLAKAAVAAPLAEHGLEAIVALTANPASLTDYVLGDHDVFHTSRPAAVAWLPVDHGAVRVRVRAAGRGFLLRAALDRAPADRPRLRLRAGDPDPPAARPARQRHRAAPLSRPLIRPAESPPCSSLASALLHPAIT